MYSLQAKPSCWRTLSTLVVYIIAVVSAMNVDNFEAMDAGDDSMIDLDPPPGQEPRFLTGNVILHDTNSPGGVSVPSSSLNWDSLKDSMGQVVGMFFGGARNPIKRLLTGATNPHNSVFRMLPNPFGLLMDAPTCDQEGKKGLCYGPLECLSLQGTIGSLCSGLAGFCCVFYRTCGQRTAQEVTYFRNKDFPKVTSAPAECDYFITKKNSKFCGVKTEIESLLNQNLASADGTQNDHPDEQTHDAINSLSFFSITYDKESDSHTPKNIVKDDAGNPGEVHDLRNKQNMTIRIPNLKTGDSSWALKVTQLRCTEFLVAGEGTGDPLLIEDLSTTFSPTTVALPPSPPPTSPSTVHPYVSPPAPPPLSSTESPGGVVSAGPPSPPPPPAENWEACGIKGNARVNRRLNVQYADTLPSLFNTRTKSRKLGIPIPTGPPLDNKMPSEYQSTEMIHDEIQFIGVTEVTQEDIQPFGVTEVTQENIQPFGVTEVTQEDIQPFGVTEVTQENIQPLRVPYDPPILDESIFHHRAEEINSQAISTRITFGQDAEVAEFPWQVGMYVNSGFHCGATLIADMYVLTAAHCVISYETNPSAITLVLGVVDLSNPNTSSRVLAKVEKVMIHESYSRTHLRNDIALLKLTKRLAYTKNIRRICLPEPGVLLEGKLATITGWGRDQNSVLKARLQKLTSEIITNKDCDLKWSSGSTMTGFIGDSMLCMNSKPGDSCNGDSGGPSVVEVTPGVFFQVGVVSFGSASCIDSNLPGVYTRVSSYKSWIYQKMMVV